MRIVDLILGTLGLTALGLLLAGAPLAEAGFSGNDQGITPRGIEGEGIVSKKAERDQAVPSTTKGWIFETGQSQAESERLAHPNSSHAQGGSMQEGMRCCLERRLTPEERAARARTLQRVLSPTGNSSQAGFDRLRVDLLLQRESQLTPAEEHEIS